MADQAEIHRMARSKYVEERRKAVDELHYNFAVLPDREQAWSDLIRLTKDKDDIVRRGAADALGSAFAHVPDKNQVWLDLIRLAQDKDNEVRYRTAYVLVSVFSHVPDKKKAWEDLHRLTHDDDSDVRWAAEGVLIPTAEILIHTLLQISDKEHAWEYLYRLTLNEYTDVRKCAAKALVVAFPQIPDKKKAWEDLIRLIQNEDIDVYYTALNSLGAALPLTPDKKQAWEDLIRLIHDQGAPALMLPLGTAFIHVPDKKKAWDDLHRLTHDDDIGVRWGATHALGSAFAHVPDKNQAWEDLHRLTQDEDSNVRRDAADALGSVFAHVPDKKQAWDDLIRLTQDEGSVVRASANYSSGRASILKSTDAESEEGFRKEMENALGFFENASKEATFSNPAKFCLPFYRSFYTLTFKKEDNEAEVQSYLSEAKSALEGSESKEKLLEAVENLANALKELQKARDFNEMKSDLNAYRRYCDRACELLDTTEEKAPGASRLIRKGLPIIDERIKGVIAEIQEKAKALCKQVKDTEYKEIGQQINNVGQELSNIRDPIRLEKDVGNMLIPLSDMCKKMPKRDRGEACEFLEKIKAEHYIEDKLSLINMFLTKISTQMNKEPKKEKAMTTIKINNSKSVQVGVGNDIIQVQDSIPPKRKSPKKQKTSTKQINPKEPAKTNENKNPPVPYLSELESEIADIFKSVYQKDRKAGVSEVNAKTLESLKHKLHDLKASGNNINWLDMGCGDGRCLEVLDDIQDRGNIYYHGIDISHKFLDDAQMRIRKYGLKSKIETMNTAAMKFDSEFDLVSAVLFLHEVDPLCLPYVIRNMLRALKSDGTLVISDFEGPYEQEEGVVSWGAQYLEKFLSNIGGARMSIGFVPSGEFPKELGFYRCYVKKPELDEGRFKKFIEGYGGFMKEKKEDSRKRREDLRSQINKRVCGILKRPDIDTKNITDEEKALLRESMGKEYGIKALKIRLLTNEILFLDEKIDEFERGERCDSI